MSNATTLPNECASRMTLGSARASRALFGALAENFPFAHPTLPEALGEAPSAAREGACAPRTAATPTR